MSATHYIEQYRQRGRTHVVNGPMQPINNLYRSLTLTRQSNCITLAVFKITFKTSINDLPDTVGGGYKQITTPMHGAEQGL